MKIKHLASTMVLALIASPSFSGSIYYHPVTGDALLDEDSVTFFGDCEDTQVDFQNEEEGRIDLLFDYIAEFDIDGRKACQMKVELEAPPGWQAVVRAESSVSGFYFDRSYAVLEHTLAGTSIAGNFEYFPDGIGSFDLSQKTTQFYGSCGEPVTLKTVTSLRSLAPGGYIELLSGGFNGENYYNVSYCIEWEPCD